MPKKPDFTKKVQNIVRRGSTPNSLEEFLNDTPLNNSSNIEIQEKINSVEDIYKREEFKFPYALSEKLRLASFRLKKTKKEIVQTALSEYLDKINF